MKKAIVTVLIGDEVTNEWSQWFSNTWRPYAKKHGYDIIIINEPIDKTSRAQERSPHWQKLLILESEKTQDYEDVVWMDHDIFINFMDAPCIVTEHASDKIGMISERHNRLHVPGYFNNYVCRSQKLYGIDPPTIDFDDPLSGLNHRYVKAGLTPDVHDTSNAGVIVLKRSLHAQHLRKVYDEYSENKFTAKEEVCLCHYLFENDLVKPLDFRFNVTWLSQMIQYYPHLAFGLYRNIPQVMMPSVTTAWHNNWFLHFTDERLNVIRSDEKCRSRHDVQFVPPYSNIEIVGAEININS